MANHKSAAKRARQTIKITARAAQNRSSVRTAEKTLLKAVSSNDTEAVSSLLKAYISKMDRAAKKGIFHANTAARKIARLSKRASAAK